MTMMTFSTNERGRNRDEVPVVNGKEKVLFRNKEKDEGRLISKSQAKSRYPKIGAERKMKENGGCLWLILCPSRFHQSSIIIQSSL